MLLPFSIMILVLAHQIEQINPEITEKKYLPNYYISMSFSGLRLVPQGVKPRSSRLLVGGGFTSLHTHFKNLPVVLLTMQRHSARMY